MTIEFQLERIADALEDLVSILTPGASGEATPRPKVPIIVESPPSKATGDGRAVAGRMRRGRPLNCGRCRREGRSRMNHSERCRECQHEEWWDE